MTKQEKKEWKSVFSKSIYIDCSSDKSLSYDDIVDDSDFKPSAEKLRDNQFKSNGSVSDPSSFKYDYPAGQKITDKVSDIVLLLRSGKLDKADVQRLNDEISQDLSKQFSDKRSKDELQKAEKASKNRTAALDEALGVNQDS